MTLRAHVVQATVGSAVAAPFLGADTVIFFASIILIDVDHYFDYVFVCRRFGLMGMFKFHDFVVENKRHVWGFSVFHTVEVFLALFILGFWSYYFWVILSGFLVHFIFDLYSLYTQDALYSRAFSIIEYIFSKRKGYPVPPKEFWEKA